MKKYFSPQHTISQAVLESRHPTLGAHGLTALGVIGLLSGWYWRISLLPNVWAVVYCLACIALLGAGIALAGRIGERRRRRAASAVDIRAFGAKLKFACAGIARAGGRPGNGSPAVGGMIIFSQISAALKRKNGDLDTATLLSALGAVAGFACLVSAINQGEDEASVSTVRGRDGAVYIFSDRIKALLGGSEESVLAHALRALKKVSRRDMPDLRALHQRLLGSVGTVAFGEPQIAPLYMPPLKPVDYLRASLEHLMPVFRRHARSSEDYWEVAAWAIVFGCESGRGALSSRLMLQIIMESAAASSCLSPELALAPVRTRDRVRAATIRHRA